MKQLVILVLIVSLLIAGTALAETRNGGLLSAGSGYGLDWWTVDNGGGASVDNGNQYALTGTAGQMDAGVSNGGQHGLVGGFWDNGDSVEHRVYLPLVLRAVP